MLLLILFCVPPLFSQDGEVIFLAYPTNARLLLDGQVVGSRGNWTKLIAGKHEVQLSCRGYTAIDTIVKVKAGERQKIKLVLEKNMSMLAYEGDLRRFVRRKTLIGISLSTLPVVGVVGFLSDRQTRVELNELSIEARKVKLLYNRTISAANLVVYRNQYEAYQAEYAQVYRRSFRRNVGLSLVAGAFSLIALRYLIKIRQNPRPSYEQVTHQQLNFQFGPSIVQGKTALNLSLIF